MHDKYMRGRDSEYGRDYNGDPGAKAKGAEQRTDKAGSYIFHIKGMGANGAACSLRGSRGGQPGTTWKAVGCGCDSKPGR